MKTENRRELRDAGINLETGTASFVGNESLFLAFLKKFPDESSYGKMTEELSQKNCEEAYRAAQTLKSLTGNLSIDSLHAKVCPLVEALRKGKLDEATGYYQEVKECYDKVVEVLKHTEYR